MIENALFALITAAGSASAALLADRAFPERLPQNPVYPALTYRIVSAPRDYVHQGQDALVRARVQLDLYGNTYGEVQALRTALVGKKGTPGVLGGRKAVVVPPAVESPVAIRRIFVRMERDHGDSSLEASGASPRGKSLDLEVWFREG